MYLLDHVEPEQATGKIKEIYELFTNGTPVPEPLKVISVSPELMAIQMEALKYYMGHERLDMQITASIRYILGYKLDYGYCYQFNRNLLAKAAGMTDEELDAMREDPSKAPFEKEQVALLEFVIKLVDAPESIDKDQIDALRKMGWTDRDIFDAASHGANFTSHAKLFKAFVK